MEKEKKSERKFRNKFLRLPLMSTLALAPKSPLVLGVVRVNQCRWSLPFRNDANEDCVNFSLAVFIVAKALAKSDRT